MTSRAPRRDSFATLAWLVLLALVILANAADPTPHFLGLARGDDATDPGAPVSAEPTSDDFDLPHAICARPSVGARASLPPAPASRAPSRARPAEAARTSRPPLAPDRRALPPLRC